LKPRTPAPDSVTCIRAELARLGAPRAAVAAATVRPMKPETRERPFNRAGWVFELKYDGFRLLAAGGAGEARLYYKSGHDATAIFPEIVQGIAALPWRGLLLDGEVTVLDAAGRPNFQRLQRRGLRTRHADVHHAMAAAPATFFVFDLLACEEFDLRPLPLAERKRLLRRLVPAGDPLIRLSEEIPERGEELYAAVAAMGLEGIVAKRGGSPYRAGYSADWLKVRVDRSSDFAVVGFEPEGGTGLRRLHLAVRDGGAGLAYAGTVGTGFRREEQEEIRARLDPLRRESPPLPRSMAAADRKTVWVEPELVVEVRYKEWTDGGHLRHPVYLRRRDDKTAAECFRPGEERADDEEEEEMDDSPDKASDAPPPPTRPAVAFTNLGKLFWPEEGITKGDLVDYYRAVSPWMLPFLRGRAVTLDRYPDGIAGKSFFQKTAGARSTAPLVCDDVDDLLYLVNLGAIPFHIGAARAGSIERPDWCILDLDPKSAPFAHVVEIALAIRELCGEIELPCHVKTSGGSGLHVLLPMGATLEHEAVRQLAELLAGVIVARLPLIATTARAIAARGGRVYVDALQNGRGKLLAAPYCARPRPGATVSTPLDWREVGGRLDVGAFNVRTVPARLRRRKRDPLLPVLGEAPDLERSLALLAERMEP
jgi:bifunctional non-homologous end joining protein LigD